MSGLANPGTANSAISSRQPGLGFVHHTVAPTHHPGMNRVVILLSLSVLINYIDRSNLSIAAPLLQSELGISNTQMGTLLSAFFWTYALMQVPIGWLVDRFDVKWVFAIGFLVWSAATAVTGVLHGFIALLLIRVVLGFGESVAMPSYSKIIGGHFTAERRGFANGIVMAGLALGPAVGMLIGGNVVAKFGWRPFFVALGLIGVLWLPPWFAWMPRRDAATKVPASLWSGWAPLLRQRSALGTAIGQTSFNYFLYFMLTWLPSYLVRGRHLSMSTMAREGALLFFMYALATMVSGKLSDRWILAGSSPTLVRKGGMAIGCTGVGLCLLFTPFVSEQLLPWILALSGTFMGIGACGTWTIAQCLSGREMVGRWVGLQNFIGNIGGAVAPWLTGYLLDRTGLFYWPFIITAVIAWIGALSWTLIVGPIQEIPWVRTVEDSLQMSSPATPESSLP